MRALSFLCVFLLLGCSSTAGIATRTDSSEIRKDSTSLARKLTIENFSKRQNGEQLQVSATLVSLTNKEQALQYKFIFFDVGGIAIEQEGQHWQAINLYGKEQRQVSAVAINANAIEAELVVRGVDKP